MAQSSHLTIPTRLCVAAVLHEFWRNHRLGEQRLQLLERHVADAQKANFLSLRQGLHGPPRLPICRFEATTRSRTMQDVGVEIVRAQMLQRALEGLLDL